MRIQPLRGWGLWAVTFVLFVHSARASSFGVIPSADAFVTKGPTANLSNNNYGGAGSVGVSAPGSAQGEFQSVMRFDLAPTKAAFDAEFGAGNWTIDSVSLQLTASGAGNAIFNTPTAGNISISWMQNDSWVEGSGNPNTPSETGISFNNLSTFTGLSDESLGTFAFAGGTSGNNVYSLTLAPGFDGDVGDGGSVSVRLFAADTSVSGIFNSRTFGTAAARPVLTVQAVPEPGTVGLVTVGVILSAWKIARRGRG